MKPLIELSASQLKSLSSDKPRKIGFCFNIVAAFGEGLKISLAQMRLVSMALQDAGLDDAYGMDRYQQEVLFTQIVRKYVSAGTDYTRAS